jgi:hypothetical protein
MMTDRSRRKWLPLLLTCGWLLAACTVQPLAPQAVAPGLDWRGPAPDGAGDVTCARLRITGEQAILQDCDGTERTVALDERYGPEWEDLFARFAPFVYETEREQLDFNGVGAVSGEAWQRAILAWARARYAELSSGRVSAAVNTAASWQLGPMDGQPDACMHLTVLTWGFAYAESVECEGRAMLESRGGWLAPGEMEQFDRWLYQRAPLYASDNYLAGTGSQAMSDPEAAEIEEWMASLWTRLWGEETGAVDAAAAPAICPVPGPDTQLFVDETAGYCLLFPAGYTAIQTVPNATELVLGSLMNHVAPRASILVEDAEGRTLDDVREQLVADYVPPGFQVEPGWITVGGVEAVMLDELPGQDLNRRVALIHNDRLYSFFFTPLGEPGQARAEMEAFYQQVIDSFRFLDEAVPPPTPDPASAEISPTDVQYIMALVDVNIRSGPGTNYEVLGDVFAGQAAGVVAATADGSWWQVVCPDERMDSCWVTADPAFTQPTTSP